MLYNILDFGAVADGRTNCAAAIQEAIDACNETGGVVFIPAGNFLSGSLRLRSNVELHLENGACLTASSVPGDMIDFSKEFEDDNEDTGWEGGCFLFACHEKNITISGQGKIDGQGRLYFYDDDAPDGFHECPLEVRGLRPRMTFLEDVENLTVKDVTFYDAAFWTLHMAGCRNVLIENIRILNNDRGPNNDGIDPDCCKNVIIRGCLIEAGDDCVVIKTTGPMARKYGDSSRITVSGCVLHSHSSAIKFGTETWADIHDVIISDCILRDCTRGIGIWSRDGGEIYRIQLHHIMGTTRQYADNGAKTTGICTWWGNGEPVFMSTARREQVDRIPGKIRDVRADHLDICAEGSLMIAGEEYAPIEGIRITESQIRFEMQSGHAPEIMDERPSVRGRYKRELPCVYLRHAPGAEIDAEFLIEESMKGWVTQERVLED